MDALERLLANAEKVAREHAPIDFIERPSSGARLPKDESNNDCAEPAEVLGASSAATEATPALKEAREGVETCPAADDTKVRNIVREPSCTGPVSQTQMTRRCTATPLLQQQPAPLAKPAWTKKIVPAAPKPAAPKPAAPELAAPKPSAQPAPVSIEDKPKRAKSAYMHFCADARVAHAEELKPLAFAEMGKRLGELWKVATAEERARCEELARKEKEELATAPKPAGGSKRKAGAQPAAWKPAEKKSRPRYQSKKKKATDAEDASADEKCPSEAEGPFADDDADREDVPWGEVKPVAILAHKQTGATRKYVVHLEGEGGLSSFADFVLHNPAKHPPLPPALVSDYEDYLAAFSQELRSQTLHGEIDLDHLRPGSKLECCSFAGTMREDGFPLAELARGGRAAKYRLFENDINGKVPLLGMSFILQRMVDVERAKIVELKERIRELDDELDRLVAHPRH